MDFPIRGWNRSRPPASQSELLKDQVRAIPLRGGRPRFVTEQVPEKAPGTCSSPPRTGGDRLPAGQAFGHLLRKRSVSKKRKHFASPGKNTRGQARGQTGVKAHGVFVGVCCILSLHKHSRPLASNSRRQAFGPRCVNTSLPKTVSDLLSEGVLNREPLGAKKEYSWASRNYLFLFQ